MEPILAATRAHATEGEIVAAMQEVFGTYTSPPFSREEEMTSTTTGSLYEIPQEMLDFRETIRQIASEKIAPRAGEIDRSAEYP